MPSYHVKRYGTLYRSSRPQYQARGMTTSEVMCVAPRSRPVVMMSFFRVHGNKEHRITELALVRRSQSQQLDHRRNTCRIVIGTRCSRFPVFGSPPMISGSGCIEVRNNDHDRITAAWNLGHDIRDTPLPARTSRNNELLTNSTHFRSRHCVEQITLCPGITVREDSAGMMSSGTLERVDELPEAPFQRFEQGRPSRCLTMMW